MINKYRCRVSENMSYQIVEQNNFRIVKEQRIIIIVSKNSYLL